MRLFVAAALLTASAMAHASPVEVWECRDLLADNWKAILVTATVESGREKGNISVAGVTHEAVFRVEGFNRRWDFGLLADGSYRYSFIIKPNGDAAYYDFGKEAEANASNLMKCRQK